MRRPIVDRDRGGGGFHGAYGNRQLATERMVPPLRAAGFHVVASDIVDYGCPDCTVAGTSGKRRVNGERPSNVLLMGLLARALRAADVTVANRERAAAASANRQLRSQSAEQARTT